MITDKSEEIINKGESINVEFKSWKKVSNMKERINLAVDELIGFANAKRGTLYFGVEDDGKITGCEKYDLQRIIESIYDKTRPPLFVEAKEIVYKGNTVIALSDGTRSFD